MPSVSRLLIGLGPGLGLALFISACANPNSDSSTTSTTSDKLTGVSLESVSDSTNAAPDLSCLDTKVDYVLNTEIIGFEMQGGGGLNAGYSPDGVSVTSINVGVNYSQGQLQTMMHLQDPLKPGVPIADVGGIAVARNISFNANFAAALASLGSSFWYSTPVATLAHNALANNLTALGENLTALDQNQWWTTITQLNGNDGFFVPVGTNAGLKVGDQLKVMDVNYIWAGDGQPCKNELVMPLIKSQIPKAFARAAQVGLDYAYFQMIGKPKSAPSPHDFVTIAALVQTNAVNNNLPFRTLARSIRLGTIKSKPLTILGQSNLSQVVDIAPYVNNDLQALLPKQNFGGFYIHQ